MSETRIVTAAETCANCIFFDAVCAYGVVYVTPEHSACCEFALRSPGSDKSLTSEDMTEFELRLLIKLLKKVSATFDE